MLKNNKLKQGKTKPLWPCWFSHLFLLSLTKQDLPNKQHIPFRSLLGTKPKNNNQRFKPSLKLRILSMSSPCPDDLADIDGVDAGIKAFVPFLGRIVAEILFRLVPNRHGFAFDD